MRHFHLDDEALSAALDGEGTSDEQAHVDSCPSCRARFDGLRAVAFAVGTAVPRRPEQAVDAAIHAALSLADEHDQADPAAAPISTASEGASGGVPRPASRQANYPASLRRVGHRPGSGSRRYARLILAAAAVVAVVLGAGLLARASGPGATPKVASGAARGRAVPEAVPGQPGQAGQPSQPGSVFVTPTNLAAPGVASRQGVAAGVLRGVSLGDQADPVALARIIDSQLAAGAVPNSSSEVSGAAPFPIPCADQGAAIAGVPGQRPILRYAAPVRWRGQDAFVLVYARAAGGLVGTVIRLQDCAALTTFNP